MSPHSPDFNPLDVYMWEYLKDRVYGNSPQSTPDLKEAITAAIRAREKCEGSARILPAESNGACSAGELIWSTFLEHQ